MSMISSTVQVNFMGLRRWMKERARGLVGFGLI